MIQTLSRKANAKINLYLRVTGKREDGYHELQSVMQSVTLADTVTVTADTSYIGQSITLTCSDPCVPCDSRNIAVKCAKAFFSFFGIGNYSVKIHIDKNIPVSAGLAGGSTDGAAVLRLLDTIYGTNAGDESLCSIGATVGADIPFCIVGGTALCEGIGEKITPLDIPSPDYKILLVSPGESVSTPEAYRLIDEAGFIPENHSLTELTDELNDGRMPVSLHNDFEAVILPTHKNTYEVKKLLFFCGASAVQMSGSGPTVFALFSDEGTRAQAERTIAEAGYKAYPCEVQQMKKGDKK